jgi:hypothetical protein
MSSDIIIVDTSKVEDMLDNYYDEMCLKDGMYAKMRREHLKNNRKDFYKRLVEKGELDKECADTQRSINNYIDRAVEYCKKHNTEYLEAQKRGDDFKMFQITNTERVFAESFAIRWFVYGIYSD